MNEESLFKWSKLDGASFQDLVADLLSKEGFDVQDNGIGQDGGIDLIAVQHVKLDENLHNTIRWAVQVKSKTGKSKTVKPSELGNIGNLLSRFNADGFMLVTNGRLTNKSFEEIRSISEGKRPNYLVNIWDNKRVEGKLLKYDNLIEQYFSEHERKSLLVIDDDPIVLKTTKTILESFGHVVHQSNSVENSLEILRQKNIGVVIIDVMLDGLTDFHKYNSSNEFDGFALAKMIREESSDAKIIYYTAYMANAEISARVGMENAVFLSKFDSDTHKLERTVDNLVDAPPEITALSNQYESVITFLNSTLHRAVSNIHAAKSLSEISYNASNMKRISSLLSASLSSIKGVMKDLALERFHTQSKELKYENFETLIEHAIKASSDSHSNSQIELISNKDFSPKILCDAKLLEMSLSNLIDNALESYSEPGQTVNVRSEIILREKRYAKIQIMDHGCGISEEQMMTLFVPGHSTKEGSGMGVYLSNKIVEFHGGWIEVHSPSQNYSTEVCVYLPLENQFLKSLEINEEPLPTSIESDTKDKRYQAFKNVFNLDFLASMDTNSRKEMLDLVFAYVSDLPELFKTMRSCINANQHNELIDALHRFKGAAGAFGVRSNIAELAVKAESLLKNGNNKEAYEPLEELLNLVEAALSEAKSADLRQHFE